MRALLTALTAALIVVLPATASAAAPDPDDFAGRQVLRWDAVYTLDADGSVAVRTEIDFDFGDEPGRGVVFTFPTVQARDDEYERVWEIDDIAASSPSGAPDDLHLETEGDRLVARIGDPDIDDIAGTQTYVLTYTVAAVMNAPDAQESESGMRGDEFYWNAIGGAWETPIHRVTITVESPAEVLDVVCFSGPRGSASNCGYMESAGTTVTFQAPYVAPRQPLTVATLYPAGSFNTEPNLRIANAFARAMAITPWTVGGAAVILLLGLAVVARVFRSTALDRTYAELTPGLAPVGFDGMTDAPTRVADRRTPVAVQFEPPPGVKPGQLGTLLDAKADVRDVTATIVDHAVRGYLRIDPIGPEDKPDDYRLVKLRDADDGMVPYGRTLFEGIFEGRDEVSLGELKTTFAADLAKVQEQMYKDVTALGWFRTNPQHARLAWGMTGVALLVAGGVLLAVLAMNGSLALLAVPIVIVALVVLATTSAAPARTPEGTRVLAQTRGFKLFMETADARQLRFEEGHDLFSKYLPYAIAFGVADKWANLFEQLAREGYEPPAPTWYGVYAPAVFWSTHSGFGRQLESLTGMVDTAVSTPTPGSSGGSGFSSGGGFSGGGSFGGGGGGW